MSQFNLNAVRIVAALVHEHVAANADWWQDELEFEQLLVSLDELIDEESGLGFEDLEESVAMAIDTLEQRSEDDTSTAAYYCEVFALLLRNAVDLGQTPPESPNPEPKKEEAEVKELKKEVEAAVVEDDQPKTDTSKLLMREFLEEDWWGWGGAVRPEGCEPLIGQVNMSWWPEEWSDAEAYEDEAGAKTVTVIADASGVSINGHAEAIHYSCSFLMATLIVRAFMREGLPTTMGEFAELGFVGDLLTSKKEVR